MREKENFGNNNNQIQDKILFFERKNETLVLENNKLKNKISLLSGQYFELIKSFQKKILDFNNFATKETDSFNQFKDNVLNDLHLYIDKVLFFIFIKNNLNFERKKKFTSIK